MGNSYFTIDEGTTKNIATYSRTVDGATVHTQKVMLDEPGFDTYHISVTANVGITSANKHLLQIMAGGTNRVYVRRFQAWQNANATTTGKVQILVYRLTTAGTGGTSYTPAPVDPSSSASGATAMSEPSSKGTEGTLLDHFYGLIHTAITTVGLDNPCLERVYDTGRARPIIISAGTSNGIAFKCTSSDATAGFVFSAIISEATY